jgi:hypothetical protein
LQAGENQTQNHAAHTGASDDRVAPDAPVRGAAPPHLASRTLSLHPQTRTKSAHLRPPIYKDASSFALRP